jgi:hypothetical protein
MFYQPIFNSYKDLLSEGNVIQGMYERRFLKEDTRFTFPIYLGIIVPKDLLYFSLIIPSELNFLIKSDSTSGLIVHVDKDDQKNLKLTISLAEVGYSELFVILASDLVDVLSKEFDSKKSIVNFNKRLEAWKSFLKAPQGKKLTQEALIGLVGELVILSELISIDDSIDTLIMWKGPFNDKSDFVGLNQSLEVKTTVNKLKNEVHISSEYQLDLNEIPELILAFVVLDKNPPHKNSFTLNELILNLMQDKSEIWIANFKVMLKAVGYDFNNTEPYEHDVYSINKINIYKVNNEFPKICGSELSQNISNVTYDLNLNGLESSLLSKDIALMEFLNK